MKLLTLDIGNTRIKWGLHTTNGWLQRGIEQHDFFAIQQHLSVQPDCVIASNVRHHLANETWCAPWSRLPCHTIYACAQQCGVRNGYQQPSQLGSDRWAALIGAHSMGAHHAIIANAGTALTIDALHKGDFLGGTIAPGYFLMQHALTEHTALAAQPRLDCKAVFPNNTAEAIAHGCCNAMVDSIVAQQQRFAQQTNTVPDLWLSGGDADLLFHKLPAARIEPWLVLEGLYRIAQEIFA